MELFGRYGIWVVILMVGLWGRGMMNCVESKALDHITWNDMKIDGWRNSLSLRDGNNGSRIIVVDKSGGGDSFTVQGAVGMVPEFSQKRVKIYILPGIYREKVHIPKNKPYISFIGSYNQADNTVISWNDKASNTDRHGIELGTYQSASVTVESDYFCATGITFENTIVASPGLKGMQAVALRITGDRAMFYKVRILGTQDTLLDQDGRHYFYQCYIEGSVDFIFGSATSLYKDCYVQSVAKKSGAIAAHHRNTPEDKSGFSFVNCTIDGTGKIFLGRAWGNYSRILYSYCYIGDIITPSGWSEWNVPSRQKTAVFGEYHCKGKGADKRGRVPWLKNFSQKEVKPFLDLKFINGHEWLKL